jgi:tryptophan synthase alpha chain
MPVLSAPFPMSPNRIDQKFAVLKARRQKAFVAYVSAGDPHLEQTPALVMALERAGVDIVELGVPFSDPLADGIVNQMAAQRALNAGTTPEGIFQAVREIRKTSEIPLVLFTYYNPVFRFGPAKFLTEARDAGVDGILLLDLPPEEIRRHPAAVPEIKNISLIAPTSPENRIADITQNSSGFIYYVSREGVTGMQNQISAGIPEKIALIRKHSPLPICVGFGISTPDQARVVAQIADGVVIGSALVKKIEDWGQNPDLPKKIEAFARPLAEAIHNP